MDGNYLRNLLGAETLGAIRAARNEKEESSVPQIQDFTSISLQQAHEGAVSMSMKITAVEHRFSSDPARLSSAPCEGSTAPLTLMDIDPGTLQEPPTFKTAEQGSSEITSVHKSTATSLRRPKRSAKSVIDNTFTGSAQPYAQWSSVAPSKDKLSVFPVEFVLYRPAQKEAFSVSDQMTAIEHRLPSVPMQWPSSVSLEDCKEKQKPHQKIREQTFRAC